MHMFQYMYLKTHSGRSRCGRPVLIVGMHVYRKEYFTYYAESFIKMHP